MNLNELREEINKIDSEMVDLFKKRMAVSAEIAEYKKIHGLPVLDAAREKDLLERISLMAGDELSDYAKELYVTVMKLSKDYQSEKLGKSKETV